MITRLDGLDAWRRRLAGLSRLPHLEAALRADAEAMAATVRSALGGGDGTPDVEIIDAGTGTATRLAIGTRAKEGWQREFGTVAVRPRPWLAPALTAHLPGIKETLRKILRTTSKDLGKA